MTTMSKTASYVIHVDGSNSHPKGEGPAACAIVVLRTDGDDPGEVSRHRKCFPTGTNNEMEINAILAAVEWANMHTTQYNSVKIISDSQWATYTTAKVLVLEDLPHYKTELYESIYKRIKIMWERDRMSLEWVRREQNQIADDAVNEALKEAKELFHK